MSDINRKYEKILRLYHLHCQKIAQMSAGPPESSEQKKKRIAGLEKEYTAWFEYYFPLYAKAPCALFHKKMARILLDNSHVSLLAEIYRSGAKSVHLDMSIPLFLYLKGELRFMLLVGETEVKAKKLLSDIQGQLQHNGRLINDYGARFKLGDWSEGDFTTSDGAKFMALGFGQSPRGVRELSERPDYIVVDDIDSKKRCNNERLSLQALEWVWEDLQGCFDEGAMRRRFVVANNNFHKNTLINQLKGEFLRLKAQMKKENKKKPYHILSVKAVQDLETFKPAWPEKTPAEYWREKFSQTPYRSFMREYMHTHIQDGKLFRHEHMQYTPALRLDQYDGLVLYADLSYKNTGDYKALVLVGKKGKTFHVIDCFLRQCSRAVCASWLYDLYEERALMHRNVKYLIEGLFAQDEFVGDFDAEGERRGYFIPVVADKKPKDNKFDRIESMAGYFERGDVFFNKKLIDKRDFQTLLDQLLSFEKGSGAHDDGPDALQSAIAELNKITFIEAFPARLISRKGLLQHKRNRF